MCAPSPALYTCPSKSLFFTSKILLQIPHPSKFSMWLRDHDLRYTSKDSVGSKDPLAAGVLQHNSKLFAYCSALLAPQQGAASFSCCYVFPSIQRCEMQQGLAAHSDFSIGPVLSGRCGLGGWRNVGLVHSQDLRVSLWPEPVVAEHCVGGLHRDAGGLREEEVHHEASYHQAPCASCHVSCTPYPHAE